MSKGRYGNYGGQYIPETLMNAVQELEEAYEKYSNDPEFNRELEDLVKNYAGRPYLTRSIMFWDRFCWPGKWEKHVSLQKQEPVSTGLQRQLQQHLWIWNVRSLWEKKIQTDRR